MLNEELTIAQTIREFAGELPEARFIIVDNGSTDETVVCAQEVLTGLSGSHNVISAPTRGKGHAMRAGLMATDAEVVVMVDGDLTYPAKAVHRLIQPVWACGADMVIGDRLTGGAYSDQNKRRFHEFGNRLIQSAINRMYRANLSDILSGYRAFSRRFVETYPVLASGFELETDLTIHALDKRMAIVEVPVEYRDRPAGSESKLHTFKDGLRVLRALVNLYRRYRPLAFFGLLSLLLMLGAIIAGAFPVSDWIRFQYVFHVPLAVLAAALVLASLVFLAIGLVLDAIAHQGRVAHETRVVRATRRTSTSNGGPASSTDAHRTSPHD